MPRDRRPYIILPLAALIAVLPLIVRGPSCGHDYDFHIISWFEAAKQFSHGNLHPQWAATPAWNAGEPRFVFYPPLSWTIGGLLGLLFPWNWTPAAYTWLALTAAGLALYHAALRFAKPNSALLAAAIYLANPYTLFTAYERTAYGELLAAAFLPLLISAILAPRPTIPSIAVPLALLWMTNAPAGVMGSYALALLAFLRLVLAATSGAQFMSGISRMSGPSRESATHLAFTTTAATLLGLALSAFCLLPAAYERRFVQSNLVILPGSDAASNFLFHLTGDPDHDHVIRTASLVALALIALTAAALAAAALTRRDLNTGAPYLTASSPDVGLRTSARTTTDHLILPLAVLTTAITLLLTPISLPVFRHFPELRFIIPWRLTAILAAGFTLALAGALDRLPLKHASTAIAALIACAALTLPAWHYFHQRCYPEDTLPTRLAIFNSTNPGTDPTDEYTPTTADNDALLQPTDLANPLAPDARLTSPAYWLADHPSAAPPANTPPAPAPRHLSLTLTEPKILIFNLRDYLAWRITLNGAPAPQRLHRNDGLIAIPLPAGASNIDITWHALPDQHLGYLISALSAAVLIVLLRNHREA